MKTKNIKDKIKKYFFVHPTQRLRVRQIERTLTVPLPSVIRYAKELTEEGILQIAEISGIKFYEANRTSKRFLINKLAYNIKNLLDSGLLEYLINEFGNPAIILFGSYSRGEDIESSDIDIYIEAASQPKIDLDKFEKILERKIHLFFYTNIKKVPNPHLANNIINGINLNGFMEVFK